MREASLWVRGSSLVSSHLWAHEIHGFPDATISTPPCYQLLKHLFNEVYQNRDKDTEIQNIL